MIIDEVKFDIEAGNGGDGSASFRREKFIPNGGPDGGDGGKGGNVYIRVNPAVHTLANFTGRKYFKAEDGVPGSKKQCSGKNGEDLYLEVPPGVIVYEEGESEKIIDDLIKPDQTHLLAKGGRGGWGNVHFKSATHQAPTEFNPGTPGEKKSLRLELKLIADVGLVGLPNAGKSTLLSRISNARPKVADYPFTTLEPMLGSVQYHDEKFIVADIPGLIEGASHGKGLGHKFLKHIERTKIIAHLIDINEPDIAKAYQTIHKELEISHHILVRKPEIIVITKTDTISPTDLNKKIAKIKRKLPKATIIPLSAVSGKGIDEFLQTVSKTLK